ncbi:glucose repression mediator protein [Gonapodya sp. JEL0774]|nr:glucose repression mediator protein [Gonapodya sp. JEL0774]
MFLLRCASRASASLPSAVGSGPLPSPCITGICQQTLQARVLPSHTRRLLHSSPVRKQGEEKAEQKHEEEKSDDSPPTKEAFDALKKDLASKAKQVAELQDAYRRALAETENVRERSRRDAEQKVLFAIQKFAKDLLEPADVLGKAIESMDPAQHPSLSSLHSGVVATRSSLLASFRRHGLEEFNPLGEKFDPSRHDAIFQAPAPEGSGRKEGEVLEVIKSGYVLNGRVVRPAQHSSALQQERTTDPSAGIPNTISFSDASQSIGSGKRADDGNHLSSRNQQPVTNATGYIFASSSLTALLLFHRPAEKKQTSSKSRILTPHSIRSRPVFHLWTTDKSETFPSTPIAKITVVEMATHPAPNHPYPAMTVSQRLTTMNEQTWLSIGTLAESMNDPDRAMAAFESALRHNPYSVPALTQIAALCRAREQYPRAVEYFNRVLSVDQGNGEVWGALGHCYLMQDDLQKAYQAYQQALYHLPNPKEPKLWYGIGILYDRYGSYDHAEEAFAAVIRMEPKFEKANEIYFRLGIIYKQQSKFDLSLQCFRYILGNPPKPLTEMDIWFQIGHVHEQQKDFDSARGAYERVLAENPTHAKVLQQLGWLYHQQSSSFVNQELAVSFLTRSLESDAGDAQTWYLLGRCFMAQQKFNKAYDAYQQAVYRDGRNPTFWCSIGVLYYQINQYRDALDAYSRAIRLNPYISEVWYDLGTLYESCNNQISDAMDAYKRALELDPNNPHVKQRLQLLEQGAHNVVPPAGPQDRVNPMAFQSQQHPNGAQGPQGQPWGPPQQIPGYSRVNGSGGPGSNHQSPLPPQRGPSGPLSEPRWNSNPPMPPHSNGTAPGNASRGPTGPNGPNGLGMQMAPMQHQSAVVPSPNMDGSRRPGYPSVTSGAPGAGQNGTLGHGSQVSNGAPAGYYGQDREQSSGTAPTPPARLYTPPNQQSTLPVPPVTSAALPTSERYTPTTTTNGLDVMAAAALSGLGSLHAASIMPPATVTPVATNGQSGLSGSNGGNGISGNNGSNSNSVITGNTGGGARSSPTDLSPLDQLAAVSAISTNTPTPSTPATATTNTEDRATVKRGLDETNYDEDDSKSEDREVKRSRKGSGDEEDVVEADEGKNKTGTS